MSDLVKKTVIITGYSCNNRCRFCIDTNKRNLPEKSTQEIVSEMIDARKRGRTYLEIIGGEQTIRPDFIYLIKMAKKIGFRDIVMSTNGRMLSYRDYTKRLIDSGVTSIIFSIHGHNAELHDSLTQVKGSFGQLLEGLKNVKQLGLRNVGSNTTIVKQNYKFLPEIGRFIYSLGIRNSEFIFVDPTSGGAHDNFKELVPRISETAPYIRRCLDIGKNNGIAHWHIRYVPLCYFVGYEKQISELYEVSYFQTEHLAPDFKNFDVQLSRKKIARIKIKKCGDCLFSKYCEGIWKEYIRHYGDRELMSIDIDLNRKDFILKINLEKIDPYTKHPKDIFKNKRYYELKNTHRQAISDIKREIRRGKKIDPIVVKIKKDSSYDLVDGFCRFMAFKELGFKTIVCQRTLNDFLKLCPAFLFIINVIITV